MNNTYLFVDFLTIIVPLLFSFHPKLNFHKKFLFFFPANLMAAVPFIVWDMLFTADKVWGFNPDYISGIYIANLPFEEVMFFICVPFACVFSYHCINLHFNISWKPMTENIFTGSFAALLLITGLIFYSRAYTAVTFVSLALLLLLLKYRLKVKWLPKLFTIYPVLLIPFFIVNGVLTGTGLEEPIVWYNDAENLGLRMFTIPFEDIFFGFELILLNVFFYEFFAGKFQSAISSSPR